MKPSKLFLKLSQVSIALILFGLVACNTGQKKEKTTETKVEQSESFFKLSLAQWSLHKAIIEEKTLDPIDFAQKNILFIAPHPDDDVIGCGALLLYLSKFPTMYWEF